MKYRIKLMQIMVCIVVLCLFDNSIYAAGKVSKTDSDEKVYDSGDDLVEVYRKTYGLVAKDVSKVQVGSQLDFWEVYIRQRGEKKVREVRLFDRVNQKRTSYKTNVVTKNAKKFYPNLAGSICVDKKNRVLFTGLTTCNYFVHHTSEKQCNKAWHPNSPYLNKVVKRNVGKTWGNNNMFAYIKNNELFITGLVVKFLFGKDECYEQDSVCGFLKGKGNQIKQVVCGENDVSGCNIFVLMKDGSVWGIGRNNRKLISASKQKKYDDFVEIIHGGVEQIAASTDNVAVIKKDNTLWLWGRTIQSKKKQYSNKPKKVADNVTEVSMSEVKKDEMGRIYSIIMYLNKTHKAYGIGYNQDYVFTKKYKKGWHSKPVLLMNNARHVYAVYGATLILDRKNNLYWSGKQGWYSGYDWIKKCR